MLPTHDDERLLIAVSMGFTDWPALAGDSRRASPARCPAFRGDLLRTRRRHPRRWPASGSNRRRRRRAGDGSPTSASASRKAMLERLQRFRQSAKYLQLPAQQSRAPRRPRPAPDRRRRRHRHARCHLAARPRFPGNDQPARRLPRPPAAVSADADQGRRDDRQFGLGGRLPDPPPDPARRSARPAPLRNRHRLARVSRTNCRRAWPSTPAIPNAKWTSCAKPTTRRSSACWRRTLPACKASNALPTTSRELADIVVQTTLDLCWSKLKQRHPHPERRRNSPSSPTASWAARNSATARISTSSTCTTTPKPRRANSTRAWASA